MDAWIAFFKANEVIVYSVYGQVFFVMGSAIAVHSMQHSRLHMARYLWLLAGFGLTHGLVEWGHVFIPIQAAYMPAAFVEGLLALQFLLLVVSFAFLLRFGAGLAIRRPGPRVPLAVGLPLVAWALATAATGLTSGNDVLVAGEIWARYLIATPACLLTGYGLLREGASVQAMGLAHIARFLRTAALSVWVYGVFSGLVTPAYDSLPARWANQESLFRVLGLPIPVIRSLAALVLAYGIIRSLDVFRVEHDRLLQEAREEKLLVAQRELAALSGVAVAVGQTRDLDSVLDNGLRRVLDILRLDRGAVYITGSELPVVSPVLCTCADAGADNHPGCGWCQRLAEEMLAAREPVVVRDTAHGQQALGIALTAGGATLGAMVLLSPRLLELPPAARQLLTSIGTQIGVTVENARLWAEVQRKKVLREQLLQRIISVQEEERKRIARELHDDTGQVLTALIIQLGAAGEALPAGAERARGILEQVRSALRDALQGIRQLISDLRPTLLDDLGLVPALRRYLESTGSVHGLRLRLQADQLPPRLPPHLETALFRIVQEGVTNAVKHAEASAVNVTLALDDGHVVARVMDNGRGFDVNALAAGQPRPGFGLLGVQERVSLLGGTLVARSAPDLGTELTARIPLSGEGPADGYRDSGAAGR